VVGFFEVLVGNRTPDITKGRPVIEWPPELGNEGIGVARSRELFASPPGSVQLSANRSRRTGNSRGGGDGYQSRRKFEGSRQFEMRSRDCGRRDAADAGWTRIEGGGSVGGQRDDEALEASNRRVGTTSVARTDKTQYALRPVQLLAVAINGSSGQRLVPLCSTRFCSGWCSSGD
jgi:hypothetical protein